MILMILLGLSDPLLTLGQPPKFVISDPQVTKIFKPGLLEKISSSEFRQCFELALIVNVMLRCIDFLSRLFTGSKEVTANRLSKNSCSQNLGYHFVKYL